MSQDRIHFVTANYYQLQGLRLVPLGLYLIALGASAAGWLTWLPGDSPHAPQRWLALAFAVALIAGAGLSAYYRCRYGSVAQFGRGGRNSFIVGAVLIFLLAAQVDQRIDAWIAVAPLWVAVSLALVVRADGQLRAHFLVGAVPWLLVALLPALHHDGNARLVAYAFAGGLSVLICGIGDHRLIAHTLIEKRDVFGGTNPRTV